MKNLTLLINDTIDKLSRIDSKDNDLDMAIDNMHRIKQSVETMNRRLDDLKNIINNMPN